MKTISEATRRAALARGVTIQVSQHAPEGYEGAYSLQLFGRVEADLGDWGTEAGLRAAARDLIAYIDRCLRAA